MATGGSPPSLETSRTMPLLIPLHDAAFRGNIDEVKELVRSGADLGATDNGGHTPLMCAVISGKQDAAAFLAKKMTVQELNVVNNDGNNVLHLMVLCHLPWPLVIQDIADTCPGLFQQEDSYGRRPIVISRLGLPRSQGVDDILKRMEQRQQQQQQQYKAGIADNVENPCNITITVVGHQGVGKSCFVRQLKQENIPENGPGSTDTADLYVNYLGYNPNTGYRQTMDGDGEIETGRQRLKRIIDRYRKDENIAVQPSEDTPAPHHDRGEGSTSLPDQLTATVNAPTMKALVLKARKKTGIKKTLQHVFSKLSYGGQVREKVQREEITHDQGSKNPSSSEVQQEAIHLAQRRKHSSSSEDKHREIPREQRDVIEAVMSTEIYVDGAEEVKGYVTIYDFGGEKVFYNTHQCFMSSNMVFVLVFDVAMCLDPSRQKDGYERIEFWLRAIATYAIDRAAHGKGTPPVILVGSHMDIVSENEEEQERMFASVLDKLYEKHEIREIMETHVQEMFPIANLNDSTKNKDTYERVWNKIISIAPLQSQWMKPVPARWVALEHELVTMKHTGRVILTYADLLEINSKSTVPLPEYDIVKFLWKLKFSGSFLCFAIHSKRPFIVLQAQWMIHAFKAIITDPEFTTKLAMKQRLQWSKYAESGILSVDFIRELWGQYKESGFLEEEDTLFIALETLGLLSKPLSVDSEVNYFVVPSILQPADPEIIRPVLDYPNTVITVALCLKFDNPFIPHAVWDKMIAACVHRFQRLEEPGLDGSKFIKRGFACLTVDCLWNMIINCCKNGMKVTMFKKDTDKSVPSGTGINLRKTLELLLEKILKLNHQSHLRYHFYLHNDYRFTADEKMVHVKDLGETPRVQCYSSNGCKWIEREDLFIWFRDPCPKTKMTHDRHVGMAKELPDRQMSPKEIGRVSRYIGKAYLMFFTELNCPVVLVEQEMEEHRHLAFRSRMTKILIHFLKTQPCTGFLAIANAMSRHGMDPSKLQNILDIDKKTVLNDDTLLGKQLSVSDVRIIADRVDVKSYFNLFLELGFTPTKLDEFDDHYRNKSSREKITALLKEFIKETRPRPTVNEILLAMQECDMDTESLIRALKPS